MNAGAKSRKKKTTLKGAIKMTESEMVKMCVVILPCVAFVLTALVAYIAENIRNRNSADLFKDKEALKLLAYMRSDD